MKTVTVLELVTFPCVSFSTISVLKKAPTRPATCSSGAPRTHVLSTDTTNLVNILWTLFTVRYKVMLSRQPFFYDRCVACCRMRSNAILCKNSLAL